MPDLYEGDSIPGDISEGQLNLTGWLPNHQPRNVEPIVEKTIEYLRGELDIRSIAAVGYCFGARYVTRFLAEGKGIDIGFVAHPTFVSNAEFAAIVNPISIAGSGEYPGTDLY